MEDPEDASPEWYPYENAATIGEIGSQGGFILRDEELGDPEDDEDADARVTLEQGRTDNPGFFVTATLYGWMFHTMRARGEAEGLAAFDQMKTDLTSLAAMIPYEEDRDVSAKAKRLTQAVSDFERRYV